MVIVSLAMQQLAQVHGPFLCGYRTGVQRFAKKLWIRWTGIYETEKCRLGTQEVVAAQREWLHVSDWVVLGCFSSHESFKREPFMQRMAQPV